LHSIICGENCIGQDGAEVSKPKLLVDLFLDNDKPIKNKPYFLGFDI
jgi:hypothetical protein